MINNFDINEIRRQFPILDRTVYGKPLVYFDNAATTQKPLCVIEREREYYLNENCNIHRGVHYLSQEATRSQEQISVSFWMAIFPVPWMLPPVVLSAPVASMQHPRAQKVCPNSRKYPKVTLWLATVWLKSTTDKVVILYWFYCVNFNALK